jgi:hypothetical protein
MKLIQRFGLMLASITCLALSASAQTSTAPTTIQDVLLAVNGEVVTPLKLTRADLDKFPRQALRAKDHDGKEYNYEGVAIVEILQKAGLKFGDALRGKALAAMCWSKQPMVTRRFMRYPNSIPNKGSSDSARRPSGWRGFSRGRRAT